MNGVIPEEYYGLPGSTDIPQRSPEYQNHPRISYVTKLPDDMHQQFLQWVQQNHVPYDPGPHADYDMPGFWLALMSGDKQATSGISPVDGRLHFTDYFKTPYHRSFSNQSKYSTSPDDPRWVGRQLIYKGNVLYEE